MNEDFEPVAMPVTPNHTTSKIALHHYVLKSWEEYEVRCLAVLKFVLTWNMPSETARDSLTAAL